MTISEATYVFSAITDIVTKDSANTYYCGTNTETTFEAAADNSPCVMGALFTVTLPSSAPALYLCGDDLSASCVLKRITTSFVPERRLIFVKV